MKKLPPLTQIVWPVAVGLIVIVGAICLLVRVGNEEATLTIAVKEGVESAALTEIARAFSRDKHVPVKVIVLPYDDLYGEELRQLKNRSERSRDGIPPFDVIMIDDPWLYSLASDPDAAPRLKNLSELLHGREEQFFDSTLRVSKFCPASDICSDRDYYAVPFLANSQLFAYRSSDFDKAPTTWQQVLDASRKAEQEHRVGYASRIGPGNSIVTDFMPILWAYDHESFPEVPKQGVALKSPERAFNALATLVGTRKTLGGASFDDFDVSAYLQQGCASMGIVWSAWAMMLVETEDSATRQMRPQGAGSTIATSNCPTLPIQMGRPTKKGERKAAEVPSHENLIFDDVPQGAGGTSQPELGVWLLAIPTGSKQSNRALEFVAYATDLADDDGAGQLKQSFTATNFGTPPPRRDVLTALEKDAEFASKHGSLIPAIRRSLLNARARPRTACWREIECRLGTTLEKMIEQGDSSDDAIKRVTTEVTPLFDKSNCNQFLRHQNGNYSCVDSPF